MGFLSMRKFVHPKAKDIQMISRIVILPEYQGFGLALKFMKIISDLYFKNGERIRIVTSLKPFIETLKKSKDWNLKRFDRVGSGSGSIHNKKNTSNFSFNRITASFEYKGNMHES